MGEGRKSVRKKPVEIAEPTSLKEVANRAAELKMSYGKYVATRLDSHLYEIPRRNTR